MNESDEELIIERTLKIVVIGDGASGKTSICTRFAQDNFGKQYMQTVGLDFFSKRLMMPGNVQVLLQIWDIGGQSLAGPMLDKYIYGTQGALVIYDVTNSASFENLKDWVKLIRRLTKDYEKPVVLSLIGNKTDLEHRRAVRIEQHLEFAEQNKMCSHYVSAKTGDSINLMFRQMAAEILGIQLNKSDMEAEITVVQASIVGQSAAELKKISNKHKKQVENKKSSVCTLQ